MYSEKRFYFVNFVYIFVFSVTSFHDDVKQTHSWGRGGAIGSERRPGWVYPNHL